MNCCDYKCTEGRDCPARKAKSEPLPITMEDEPTFVFDRSMRMLRDLCAAVGLVAIVGLIAFFFWCKS